MADETVPTAIGAQAFLEAPATVIAHIVGTRAVVTFGADQAGVRLLGDATAVHLMIVEADRQLTHLRDGA